MYAHRFKVGGLAVLDVLRAADNPLLDIPVAGAMLSEMFSFTPDEIAEIRAKTPKELGELIKTI